MTCRWFGCKNKWWCVGL